MVRVNQIISLCLTGTYRRSVKTFLAIFCILKIKRQRICIVFCVQNVIECNKVARTLIKAFGKVSMSKFRVYDWYKRSKEGVNDDKRTEHINH